VEYRVHLVRPMADKDFLADRAKLEITPVSGDRIQEL
jgi:hypothetical protein